ncbi:hypothetical protein LTR87_000471 [Friedmanniomyces endolithicus]|nr:hypothetical protein LTR87_000471 [Friedmanniomyces endolithicus]
MRYAIGIIAGLIYALFQMALILPLYGILLVLLTGTDLRHTRSSPPWSTPSGHKHSETREEWDDDDDQNSSSCPSACPSARGMHSKFSTMSSNRDTINGMRNTNIVCVHGGTVGSKSRKPKNPDHGALPTPLANGNNGMNDGNNGPVSPLPYNNAPISVSPVNSDRCFSAQDHYAEQDHFGYENVDEMINNHRSAQADHHTRLY